MKEDKTLTEKISKYTLLLHIPLSLFVCFGLEWLSRHSFHEACVFVTERTLPFLYNSFLIFVCFTPIFLFRRRTLIRTFIFGVFLTMGITNCIVLINRVSPFGFSDIGMIADLLTMQNTNYFTWPQFIMSASGFLVFFLLLFIIYKKVPPCEPALSFPLRATLIFFAFFSIVPITYSLRRAEILTSYFGNLAQGYYDYGYIYGFGTSAIDRGMTKPLGYTRGRINIIKNHLDDTETTLDKKHSPNIVVVLLESYFDVSEASFIRYDDDPIPFFHELEKNYSTGHLRVPVVGAGTCNTEFEILTGMACQFFGPGEYPQKTVLKDTESCESAASVLSTLGYSSCAVHDYGGDFYSRKNAFSKMGFDRFICEETLDITDYTPMGSWPEDDILIQPTVDAMTSTEGSDFIYAITVGTHGDYPGYPVIDKPEVEVECKGKTTEQKYKWLYYINMLHTMDNWMRDFITAIDSTGEDTLVIMFGDHLPTMGLYEREVSTHDLYKTKYVTWNNFGMKKKDTDLYSYQLLSEYFDRLGIHEGNFFRYNQSQKNAGIKAGSDRYMMPLSMLQYDLLYGEHYLYNSGTPYPANPDITMGIYPITIERTYRYGGNIYIYGDGFTPWSKVFSDGNKLDTTYKSGQLLTISEDSIKDGDSIRVAQVGDAFMDNSTSIFAESNTYMVTLPQNTIISGGERR